MSKHAEKPHLAVVVLGHEGVGKSTLAGHLLHQCDMVPESLMNAATEAATELQRPFARYAFLLDTIRHERYRCMSYDISVRKLICANYQVTLIDAPGRRNFRKNMNAGIAQADVAIIVVNADISVFEPSLKTAKEHAMLAFSLNVSDIIVTINKSDLHEKDFEQGVFDDLKANLAASLKIIGFNPEQVRWVPVGAWTGENLTARGDRIPWWTGETLLQAIDAPKLTDVWSPRFHQTGRSGVKFRPAVRALLSLRARGDAAEGDLLSVTWSALPLEVFELVVAHLFTLSRSRVAFPFRLSISVVHRLRHAWHRFPEGSGHGPDNPLIVVEGRVATGRVRVGQRVVVSPGARLCTVLSIQSFHEDLDRAHAGQWVALALSDVRAEDLRRGMVVSDPNDHPARACTEFTAALAIMGSGDKRRIRRGYMPMLDHQNVHVECRFEELVSMLTSKGRDGELHPTELKRRDFALVRLVPRVPICVETVHDFPHFCRVTIRDHNDTVAVGYIKTVVWE